MSIRIINLSVIRYSLLYLFLCMLSLVAMFCPTLSGKKWFSCYNLIASKK